MLGNDVVDLLDAESRPETFRARFDERVFTKAERTAIGRDPNPLALRWAFWAAKEAVYKLVKQIDDSFVFSPQRIEVEFEPPRRASGRASQRCGIVAWGDPAPVDRKDPTSSQAPQTSTARSGKKADETNSPNALVALGQIEVRSYETDDYVHVMALPQGADWDAVDCKVAPLEDMAADPSAAVRVLAIGEVARSLGVDAARLRIGRQPKAADLEANPMSRVPTVELDGAPTSLSLSLSHHGRFIAFAMRPRSERSGITETDLVIVRALTGSGALFL